MGLEEIGFGKINELVELEDNSFMERETVIYNYRPRREIRSLTITLPVKEFCDVENEIKSLLDEVKSGNCLDFSIDVMIDKKTGLPKKLIKRKVDPNSKIRD